MKSSSNSVFNNNGYNGLFDENEKRVLKILLDLPNLVYEYEWRRKFPSLCWGKKLRRSALEDSPTSSPPSTSCSQPEKVKCVIKVKKNKVETAVAAGTTSPSTPLLFSPSESDENKSSKQSVKSNSKKRRREELLELIDRLSRNKELLKEELAIVRNKHSKLVSTNLELKAKKPKLSSDDQKTPQLGMNGLYIEHYQQHHQMTKFAPQFLMEYKSYIQRTPPNETSPHHGVRLVNLCPRGIPDLNVCLEEETCALAAPSQPLDLMSEMRMMDNSSRLRAAEARRRRMMKIKEVKNRGRSQSQTHRGP